VSIIGILSQLCLTVPWMLVRQVAQLWQRHRARSAILKQKVILRLNLRLKGCNSGQYLWTVRWGNGYFTTLPLNLFTQRNIVAAKKQKMASLAKL